MCYLFLGKINLQSIGGFNDGLSQSSSRFMEVIHGIQAFQDYVATGWYDFLDGIGILVDIFS